MRRSMLRRLAVSGALVAGVACGSADAPEPMLSSGLPAGDPTDVGMVDEGLARIRPAMQAYVDDRRVAGVMTMVARQGRVVHWDAVGLRDLATKPDDIFSCLLDDQTGDLRRRDDPGGAGEGLAR